MGKNFLLLTLILLFSGGSQSASALQTIPKNATTTQKRPTRTALEIVVPDTVKGQWLSVDIAVFDHQTNYQKTYTVPIGTIIQLPDSSLQLRANVFLPAFVIVGQRITSASNKTRNPATHIDIFDQQTKLFSGWLFSLYPDAHIAQNTRYDFSLTGFTPKSN